ncbi:hypothetical protein ATC00_21440 [Sinorhizobium americanum]|nr:hypothetical protein ATC00_21440 [Sinorhizobium americanum]
MCCYRRFFARLGDSTLVQKTALGSLAGVKETNSFFIREPRDIAVQACMFIGSPPFHGILRRI